MKRKTSLMRNLLFFLLILFLLVSNAHAFLVTTELNSYSVEFEPADPNSTMSIEWDSYSGSARASANQRTGHGTYSSQNSVSLYEQKSITVDAATEDSLTTVGVDDNNVVVTADMGEDTADGLQSYGSWGYEGYFTVHGDGWLVISAVHDADFETNPTFDLDYRSSADLSLHNFPSSSIHRDNSNFDEDSSEFTDSLSIRSFFNDGDDGRLGVHLRTYASNHEANPIPIPGALWLLGSGLSFLLAVKKRSR